MTVDMNDLIGRRVGRYTVDRLLGHGGFSWVFAAHAADTGQQVALKVLKPRYAGDPQFESRFRNEAGVAAELKHPNIVPIHEVGADRGLTFFAMDLYPDSLASLLAREGRLPEDRLLAIGIDVAEALEFAHRAGLVHRDLKVDNILLQPDGRAVLSDFGIARAVSGYLTATGQNMTIGTPAYISPEQAQGRTLDGRSDLYALGVTLYKAATGDLPFRSTDWFELARMHVEDAPSPPTARRPDLSQRFERIILRCLAKHPDDRYPSAGQLAEDLRAVAAGRKRTTEIPVPRLRPTTQMLGQGFRMPGPWLRRLGSLALIVAVALLVMWLAKR